MKNLYNDLYEVMKNNHGIEKSQEIIDSIKYVLDDCRVEKTLPAINYMNDMCGHFDNLFKKERIKNKILMFIIILIFILNIYLAIK